MGFLHDVASVSVLGSRHWELARARPLGNRCSSSRAQPLISIKLGDLESPYPTPSEADCHFSVQMMIVNKEELGALSCSVAFVM